MAKLEEKVTPSDLLSAIRAGRLKDELIKEYRSSDEEFAMMLLPLYRNGELKKDEFNRFFKGESLTAEETPPALEKAQAPEEKPEVDHDAPTEFLGAFSRVFSRKPGTPPASEAAPEKPETDEERQEAPTQPVLEAMEEAEKEEPLDEPIEEADSDLDLELKDTAEVEELEEEARAGFEEEAEEELETEPDFGEFTDLPEEEAVLKEPEPAAQFGAALDETTEAQPDDEKEILNALEEIRSKLASIESRLTKLESKS